MPHSLYPFPTPAGKRTYGRFLPPFRPDTEQETLGNRRLSWHVSYRRARQKHRPFSPDIRTRTHHRVHRSKDAFTIGRQSFGQTSFRMKSGSSTQITGMATQDAERVHLLTSESPEKRHKTLHESIRQKTERHENKSPVQQQSASWRIQKKFTDDFRQSEPTFLFSQKSPARKRYHDRTYRYGNSPESTS